MKKTIVKQKIRQRGYLPDFKSIKSGETLTERIITNLSNAIPDKAIDEALVEIRDENIAFEAEKEERKKKRAEKRENTSSESTAQPGEEEEEQENSNE